MDFYLVTFAILLILFVFIIFLVDLGKNIYPFQVFLLFIGSVFAGVLLTNAYHYEAINEYDTLKSRNESDKNIKGQASVPTDGDTIDVNYIYLTEEEYNKLNASLENNVPK